MTSDIFLVFLTYLLTLISLFSKIRFSLTYLPKNLTLYVNAPLARFAIIKKLNKEDKIKLCFGNLCLLQQRIIFRYFQTLAI